MLNSSIRYIDNRLFCDYIPVHEIVAQVGTPVYIYSLHRALSNLRRIQAAFTDVNAHVHYSAKANANLAILKTLVKAGAGIDAVSAGEIHRALLADTPPQQIVFAGVGKTPDELAYALSQSVGWYNVENAPECDLLNDIVAQLHLPPAQVALRLNPEITANTHPYIATGHGGAKFGLTADAVRDILSRQKDYPNLRLAGIHIHIGSQLHDINATCQAVEAALKLIAPYPEIRTINIGGGLPVAYAPDETLPSVEEFAEALKPLLAGYNVILEPGRSIIADAGMLVSNIIYVKQQAGQTFYITDASMTELLRPALYDAHHEIIPIVKTSELTEAINVVGPVCETADVLGRGIPLPAMSPGEPLAILNAGAYGMVMANNYNMRPRPPEIVVRPDGKQWDIVRRRETWADMLRLEISP